MSSDRPSRPSQGGFYLIAGMIFAGLIGAVLVFIWLLGGCTDAQRRVVAAHEIRVEQDCKRIEANPLTPNVVRLSCDTGELVVDIVSTGLDLASLDGGNE